MADLSDTMSTIEAIVGFALRLVGSAFEILGVLIIIGGVTLTLALCAPWVATPHLRRCLRH